MRIVAQYNFNNGYSFIKKHYSTLLDKIYDVIVSVDAKKCKTKISHKKMMSEKLLYQPSSLNNEFKQAFYSRNWQTQRVACDYSSKYYIDGYQPKLSKAHFAKWIF
ncbi:MAG: hypothetical protein Q4C95_06125 [Planctomycetia bacterium]|nr:hypothetical protein [Planctomycetia bacterium]